jgi:hypothetical protein
MSKRLQVLVPEAQYRELKSAARRDGTSVGAWVRRVLAEACRRQPRGDVERKLAALRRAMRYAAPAPDIGQMNAEIERGYVVDGAG